MSQHLLLLCRCMLRHKIGYNRITKQSLLYAHCKLTIHLFLHCFIIYFKHILAWLFIFMSTLYYMLCVLYLVSGHFLCFCYTSVMSRPQSLALILSSPHPHVSHIWLTQLYTKNHLFILLICLSRDFNHFRELYYVQLTSSKVHFSLRTSPS